MARKIRFRQQRLYNLKILIVILLFISVLTGGLMAVDIGKSYIFYGQYRLEIFQVEPVGKDIYQVSILNDKFQLNLKYLKSNIEELKAFFS